MTTARPFPCVHNAQSIVQCNALCVATQCKPIRASPVLSKPRHLNPIQSNPILIGIRYYICICICLWSSSQCVVVVLYCMEYNGRGRCGAQSGPRGAAQGDETPAGRSLPPATSTRAARGARQERQGQVCSKNAVLCVPARTSGGQALADWSLQGVRGVVHRSPSWHAEHQEEKQ